MMFNKLNPLVKLALGGFFLSLLSLGIWIFVNDGDKRLAFGFVTEVAPNAITIENRHETILVHVTSTTTIAQRRETRSLDDVDVGRFVQVRGIPLGPQTLEAESIFLLRATKDDPPPKQP